jgi:hypothetical protein
MMSAARSRPLTAWMVAWSWRARVLYRYRGALAARRDSSASLRSSRWAPAPAPLVTAYYPAVIGGAEEVPE